MEQEKTKPEDFLKKSRSIYGEHKDEILELISKGYLRSSIHRYLNAKYGITVHIKNFNIFVSKIMKERNESNNDLSLKRVQSVALPTQPTKGSLNPPPPLSDFGSDQEGELDYFKRNKK